VPLAAHKRRVAGTPEGRRPGLVAQQLLIDPEQVTTRQQHCARRHASRPVHPPLHVRPVENQPALHKPVQVGRLDHRIAQRRNRVGTLVVGEKYQHVGTLGRLRRSAAQRNPYQ